MRWNCMPSPALYCRNALNHAVGMLTLPRSLVVVLAVLCAEVALLDVVEEEARPLIAALAQLLVELLLHLLAFRARLLARTIVITLIVLLRILGFGVVSTVATFLRLALLLLLSASAP